MDLNYKDHLKLVDGNDPILHSKVEAVSADLDRFAFTSLLVRNMEHYDGIGLSANQIGFPERAFAILLQGTPVVCYNPRISKRSRERSPLVEGCLSFPNTMVNVIRPTTISVKYENEEGVVTQVTLTGLEAKCFQHELDHLNGITMLDVGNPIT